MGNAVGSLELPKILHARKNLTLALTERQREILIGCVLGDAHIQPQGKICIEQSTHQKEYVLWKFRELKNLSYPAEPREIFRKDTRSGKEYHSIYFYLRQYFRSWRNIFYREGKKVFPDNIILTPLSLAVWYMDDGCLSKGKSTISIEGFDEESRNNVQKAFLNQFHIETVIGKSKKLVIKKKSQDLFYSLISPHIIPSMEYKIPSKPRNDFLAMREE
ncbi:MAG: hypothetical protein A2822_01175 [Candidatus Staskawiczbacteria bacterium RIFCSPHIGHO2_01_FULL_41_41]|uniref:Homing endonuclease LAGLIDADG domain-containing protein n=1 Tax=Candidatus Staskawiczbacteria bacterium RIFCSPHIGHO2_01_FULL_41_41 TaxID=1802203 RepID=A0A1G2HTG4_9BACT|nr:MAG: hypothetical protein A2822_01175 [Candidatus Staskawiczbacteria bacterium RIFCSPHIGHO2_01_FULL_41_41]